MASIISMDSINSDVFNVDQLSNQPSPQRYNSPNILNSTELSGTHPREMPTISSVASPEPDLVTLEDDSNDSTFLYRFGAQQPIVLLSLNDLNLRPNSFNILAIMDITINIAPSHRSQMNHLPSQQHPWLWAQLMVGKLRVPQRTTTFSIRMTNHDKYTGPLPWMKLSFRNVNPDDSTCCPFHPRRHHLASWKGDRKNFSKKTGSVKARLWGLPPSYSTNKRLSRTVH